MTRKDFEAIASVVNSSLTAYPDSKELHYFARLMSYRLKQENERFDRERFLKACGVE